MSSHDNKNSHEDDLDALIEHEFGNKQPRKNNSTESAKPILDKKAADHESFEIPDSLYANQTQAHPQQKNTHTELEQPLSLNTLLNETLSETAVQSKATVTAKTVKNTPDIHSLLTPSSTADNKHKNEPIQKKTSPTVIPTLNGINVIILILIVAGVTGAFLLNFKQRATLQTQIEELAKAVDHFYMETNTLPEKLSSFSAFPEKAVEWPIKYWNARHQDNKPLVFWLPKIAPDYWIAIKQGDRFVIKRYDLPVKKGRQKTD